MLRKNGATFWGVGHSNFLWRLRNVGCWSIAASHYIGTQKGHQCGISCNSVESIGRSLALVYRRARPPFLLVIMEPRCFIMVGQLDRSSGWFLRGVTQKNSVLVKAEFLEAKNTWTSSKEASFRRFYKARPTEPRTLKPYVITYYDSMRHPR